MHLYNIKLILIVSNLCDFNLVRRDQNECAPESSLVCDNHIHSCIYFLLLDTLSLVHVI